MLTEKKLYLPLVLLLFCVSNCLCKINCTDVNIVIAKNANEGESITFDGITYKPNEYIRNETTGEIHGCICEKKTCVNKCCPIGYNTKGKNCVNTNKTFDPPIWNDYTQLKNNASEFVHFYSTSKKLNCSAFGASKFKITSLEIFDWRLQSDGNLYHPNPGSDPPYLLHSSERFCIDNFVPRGSDETNITLDALICLKPDEENEHLNYNLTAICMLISCAFILLTVAVYLFIPELRTLHGMVLVTYLMCLFVGFLFLATMQLTKVYGTNTGTVCVTLTFIVYFGFLTAFFWLSVMSFDVWSNLRRNLSINKLSIRQRYAAYALFGFGIPLLLTVLLAILEFADLPYHHLLPLIRRNACFIAGKSKFLYFYGPMLLAWFINITFFILTAVEIEKHKKYICNDNNEPANQSRLTYDKKRLILYVELFFLTGLMWILEIFSAIYPEPKAFWYITDIYNLLSGFTIFVLFVLFKPKVLRQLKNRVNRLKGQTPREAETWTSTQLEQENQLVMDNIDGDSKERH